ncbi:GNAT family N-acetyltransferase [Actinoplanes sp. HUAS TT8]|uniref:GNAT family N-acetyltransferase n=1 Tax=Actinoplanes sp. HUAS TT8 TaxID=3447453 RepID=UPI003F520998
MRLIDAHELDETALAAAEEIYTEAFPDGLRAPFPSLLDDDTVVLTVNGRPAGLAVSRPLGPTGWVFLRYFAVADRGRGTGSALWRLACARWAAAGFSKVLLDVEDPAEPDITHDEHLQRKRRIVFYQRLGARLLPVRDFAPEQPGGDQHGLRLFVADTQPDPVRDLVLAVYKYRYGLDEHDPVVRRTLQNSELDPDLPPGMVNSSVGGPAL